MIANFDGYCCETGERITGGTSNIFWNGFGWELSEDQTSRAEQRTTTVKTTRGRAVQVDETIAGDIVGRPSARDAMVDAGEARNLGVHTFEIVTRDPESGRKIVSMLTVEEALCLAAGLRRFANRMREIDRGVAIGRRAAPQERGTGSTRRAA